MIRRVRGVTLRNPGAVRTQYAMGNLNDTYESLFVRCGGSSFVLLVFTLHVPV